MMDMHWADGDYIAQSFRKSMRLDGDLNLEQIEMENQSDNGGDDSDNDGCANVTPSSDSPQREDSFSKAKPSLMAKTESRLSINEFDMDYLVPMKTFSKESLTAGVVYDPIIADGVNEVSILLDGIDLSKSKYFMMILPLITLSYAADDDSTSYSGSHSSRFLSPLARLKRTQADLDMENFAHDMKNTMSKQCNGVIEVSLRYCKVGEKSLFKLFSSLRGNTTVVNLNLCGNTFKSDNVAASLGNLLNFNRTLERVNVQETLMGNVGCTLISQSLHINDSVTELELSANNINAQGCVMLASALAENKALTKLNLSRNAIGSRGVRSLTTALHENKHLIHLDLGRQRLKGKIGHDGAKYLARCLMVNSSIRILRIGRNRLGFEGCRYICGALLSNNTLQVLDLGRNKIGIEGAIQVANAVLQNSCLEFVVIGHRKLPICHLIGHFHENRRLTECSFIFNFQNQNYSDSKNIAQSIVQDKIEEEFEKELEFDNNVYFADDSAKVHCDSVFKPTRSDFDCIDFQVIKPSSKHDTSNKETAILSITDEEAVFIAHLIKDNFRLESLRIDHTFLPVQKLRGRPYEVEIDDSGVIAESEFYNLDLSKSRINCPDAVVIGILIADNPRLKLISLHGNNFCKTEGETWITNALAKNPNLGIDSSSWSAEEMYADGYHQLASVKGISAAGAPIMPQRLEDRFDLLCVVGGAAAYYLDFLSDVYVTYLYSQNPDVYQSSWVILSAVFLSLPTCKLSPECSIKFVNDIQLTCFV